jgi:hypothetical protein
MYTIYIYELREHVLYKIYMETLKPGCRKTRRGRRRRRR